MDPKRRRIHDEMEHHLAELEARLQADGMPADRAREEARRRFGDPRRVERDTRAADGPDARAAGAWSDARHVLRGLRRAPAFTAAVVLTLTLALGATIAVFGVVWDVLLRPFDLRDAEGLVVLLERMPEQGIEASPASEGNFQDWRRELRTVRDLVAWEWINRTLEDPDRPEELVGLQVSGDFFAVLGLRAALGRALTVDDVPDEGAPATRVMLGYEFWERRFGSDPGVIGRTLPLDGVDREIVGVAPRRLELVQTQPAMIVAGAHVPDDPTNRGGRFLGVLGRLATGASVEAATAEVAAVSERIAEAYPTSARGWSARALPLRDHLLGDVRPRLAVAALAVVLLLLVAVVNVTNLLSVRAADGRREMAVRVALGAGRGRLVRMRLIESLALGILGSAGGVALATFLQRWLAATHGDVLPRGFEVGVPSTTLIFAAVLAGVVGLAVGVVPALRSAEAGVGGLGRGQAGVGGASGGARTRQLLVVVQIGLTAVLLVGAGLLVRTVDAVRSIDVGFDPTGVVAARVSVDSGRYPTAAALRAYFDDLLARVRALPGVEAAGVTSALPMDPIAPSFDLPTRTDESVDWGEAPQVDFRLVSPGLMEALDFRLVEGRFFDARDVDGPLAAVVSRSAAERFWPGRSALGEPIQVVWRADSFARVVGVVEDTRFYGPREAPRAELFYPSTSAGWSLMTVAARGRGDPGLADRLERAVAQADPLLPAQEVFAVSSLVEAATANERLYASLLAGFGLLALALAAAGVYGVLAYAVRMRTREMGVRMALGESRGGVTGRVVRGGLGLAVAGALLGLGASVPSTRFVAGMLYGVEPLDPATLAAVVALLMLVALAACLAPAWRAARLDPANVLREE